MLNDLLLLSHNDIPFPQAKLTIHNPTLNEIALIGEEKFLTGLQILNISKDILNEKDNFDLSDIDDFDIFMLMMKDKKKKELRNNVFFIFALLFPNHKINITEKEIELSFENEKSILNKDNFFDFKSIISEIFCFKDVAGDSINPADKTASKIAEKIKKAKEKRNRQQSIETKKINLYVRYVSILAVGEQKDINSLMNYTVFQLMDEFKRYTLKQNFDYTLQAKMAGATDVKEADNWMDDIHT